MADLVDELIRRDGKFPPGKGQAVKIADLSRPDQARLVEGLAGRLRDYERDQAQRSPGFKDGYWSCVAEVRELLRRKLPLSEGAIIGLLEWLVIAGNPSHYVYPIAGIATAAAHFAKENEPGGRLREALVDVIAILRRGNDPESRRSADKLAALVVDAPVVQIDPDEAWSDAALADLGAMPADARRRWDALLAHCQATGGNNKLSARWLGAARTFVEAVGPSDFKARVLRWFPLVDKPRTVPFERAEPWEPDPTGLIQPSHADLLKGLAWCSGIAEDRDLARALASLALSAYRKVPGRGPRLVALGNACVAALGMMPGLASVGQLALLKVKVKFATAQKEVEKALDVAARRAGLPRDEVEEIGVPAYGLEEVGRRREVLGDYVAELVVDGSDVATRWSRSDGKPLKSAPAAVKKEHAEEVKDLQAAAKEAARMLTAQRGRIDGLFLARKSWPFDAWRGRYLDHPLVGTIARRLLWQFTTGGRAVDGGWHDGHLVGLDGRPLDGLGAETAVTLWHPIGRPVDDVLAWRAWLEERQVRQPFKQAHREVYLLTDAERRTVTYSNRYAAHVLRQHQYHALCAARGWKDTLRLMVDDSFPPTSLRLPAWGLRAEFWVEAAGDDYATDINETGVYLRLTTDQVRFYPVAAAQRTSHSGTGGYLPAWNRPETEPLPLEEIPPLVFSEVMRDVDLFVGVASVGNDPTWADGGPGGRFRDYWQSYSFGDLNESARTRRAVLELLVTRLKVADRCSFADRFLVVRGDLRTYKIHLGSGNILMEPNDQYLCIVPRQSPATAGDGRMFLPFEGDNLLSIIVSKALLLADDTRITDATITRQIR